MSDCDVAVRAGRPSDKEASMETLIAAVAAAILSLMPQWKSEAKQQKAEDYAQIIVEESQAVQPEIDPFLVVAIIFRESSFRRKVKGKRGEVGLMQIMPRGTLTRSITRDDLTDVRANVRVGIGHLHYWQEECGSDDMVLWLSAYNAGKCKKTFYGKSVRKLYCKIKPGGCGGVS
jgi:soluble lytic murein transglycosylase-like protein